MKYPEKDELLNRYENYSDDELLAILRNPGGYQEQAVEIARGIAEQRGLNVAAGISEDAGQRTSIFPHLSTPEKSMKLLRSLQRLLYFVALIPLITGALSFADGYPSLAIAYVSLALLWGAVAFMAVSRKKHTMVLLLFLLLGFMLVLRYITAGLPVAASVADWFIMVLAIVLLVYVLLYFKKLIRYCFKGTTES
ncbi:hypothetical protein [Mangrovibacterium sp.]|uniref:hypothetical protein n=1 Tax=Mangrovibacterium sp. TaxID=1961364 RepID=UPI0035657A31